MVERILEERKQKGAELDDARLHYRTKARELFGDGSICNAERDTLDELRVELGLSQADADQIEREEGAPYTKKDAARDKYGNTLRKIVEEAFPIGDKHRESLDGRMRDLGLSAEDVKHIEAEIFAQAEAKHAERRASSKQAAVAEAAQTRVGEARAVEPEQPKTTSSAGKKVSKAPAPPKGELDAALAWAEAVAAIRKGRASAIELEVAGVRVTNNPSEHQIRAVLEGIRATDTEPFACLGTGLSYVQAYRGKSDWAAEFQNGDISQHFAASDGVDLAQVIQLFVSFRNGEQGWPESITWTHVEM